MRDDLERRVAWLEVELKKLRRRIDLLEAIIERFRWLVRALR